GQRARSACRSHATAAQCTEREKAETGSCYPSDRDPDDDEHARSLPRAGVVPAGVRVVRAGARRSSSTATPDMLESGRARLARASTGGSTHRRSEFASFALIVALWDLWVWVRFG